MHHDIDKIQGDPAGTHVFRAHHAFAADYEAGNEGTISGVIKEVMFRNPHARYYLEVTNEDGSTELWDLETLNLMMLGRMGWDKNTIKVGDEVKVKVILVDDQGRIKLSRKQAIAEAKPAADEGGAEAEAEEAGATA